MILKILLGLTSKRNFRYPNLIKNVKFFHQVSIKELKLKEYGNAETGLELFTSIFKTNELKKNQVLVKLVAAPINPADLNIIQGKYGILPQNLPSVIGNEGLFEVVEVNESVKNLKKGDWVLPNRLVWGTWRSHAVEDENSFIKLPFNNINKNACATLAVNPVTAYAMLKNFKKLNPNDTVIQNGANSGVGQAVIQLGNLMNINVVNIVRKRENQAELNSYLESIGAKYIFTDDELRKSSRLQLDLWKEIPKPILAFNCVGGKTTTDLIRLLDKDSSLITYGGMSRQPLTVNTADFIFKNIKCLGFWLSTWRSKNPEEYKKVIFELCELIAAGKLKPPRCEEFILDNYIEAFKRVQTPFINSKILFKN